MQYILVWSILLVLFLYWRWQNRELEKQVLTVLLRRGEMYGLQIIEVLEESFGSKVGFGTLYPTLRRLERKGLVMSRWGEQHPEERGRARHKYYRRIGGKRIKLADCQHEAVEYWGKGAAYLGLR